MKKNDLFFDKTFFYHMIKTHKIKKKRFKLIRKAAFRHRLAIENK